jgi:hypothetical protein
MWNIIGYATIGLFTAMAFLVGFGGAVMNWPFVADVIGYAPLVIVGGAALVGALVLLSKGLDHLPEKAFYVFLGCWMVCWFIGGLVGSMFIEDETIAEACYYGGIAMAFSLPVVRALEAPSKKEA